MGFPPRQHHLENPGEMGGPLAPPACCLLDSVWNLPCGPLWGDPAFTAIGRPCPCPLPAAVTVPEVSVGEKWRLPQPRQVATTWSEPSADTALQGDRVSGVSCGRGWVREVCRWRGGAD